MTISQAWWVALKAEEREIGDEGGWDGGYIERIKWKIGKQVQDKIEK